MAKKSTSKSDELFELLRARGLRKRAARALSDAATTARGGSNASQATAKKLIGDLRGLADEMEDRVTGRQAKRQEAAKKAARTRARNAKARSAAAKKGAATRKRTTRPKTTKR
ncbi:MAG: hypothetical protein AVDCRST_MAG85-2242 [uncultured Solirubrobacteraceae bacterium]|uniref:Uncharacterized protein n=1 Tax=uncultured Solirubrobacteraceae bacterium TaxID=1162706 RepID=A0A6J4SZT2_9ACTN|nr:MAG: hypothetical protein AVDCRST_MAG85-2242 [uncultured Solirubrobacteraceae bacterium]